MTRTSGNAEAEAEITIRAVEAHDHEALKACEELQREIWGSEPIQIVSDHVLITAIANGGLLLMAYHDDKPIGFAFSFIGLQEGKPKHCSLMAGVVAEARYRGVGYRLKLAQREHALRQGLELITWTFDPLQSANARFNLHKLGALPVRYLREFYGEMRDELNRGLPTDRFFVEWWLRSRRVESKLEGNYKTPELKELLAHGVPVMNRTAEREGWRHNVELLLDLEAPKMLLEIPMNTPEMKRAKPGLARQWRLETRALLENCFARGYLPTEFILSEDRKRGYYLLERTSKGEVLERDGLQA